jgi:hypothetical protein
MAVNLTAKRVSKLLKTPGRYRDQAAKGLLLVVKNDHAASWILRYEIGGHERWLGLGSVSTVSLREAREKAHAARQQILAGEDPVDRKHAEREGRRQETVFDKVAQLVKPANSIQEFIGRKFADFAARGVEPTNYLYRHYAPDGDVLYVGLTWRKEIAFIAVEPFATREEVIAAEKLAIRTELPKYNIIHNGYRSPIEELIHAGDRKPLTYKQAYQKALQGDTGHQKREPLIYRQADYHHPERGRMGMSTFYLHVDEHTGGEYYFPSMPEPSTPVMRIEIDRGSKDYWVETTTTVAFWKDGGIASDGGEMIFLEGEVLMPIPRGLGWSKVGYRPSGWNDGVGDCEIWQRKRMIRA